jgi:predicted transposase YbfD/YdcC
MKHIFLECFGSLEDTRYKNKQYNLLDIVAIVICGTLAGMKDFVEIEMFAIEQNDWFAKNLSIVEIPSHDTLSRVMSLLNPKQFTDCFLLWIKEIKELLSEDVVAIDGKTLCGSHQRSRGKKALHIVNAYSCANGLTLGQIKVADKSNEITAIPELLKALSICGATVTIDAMGCQREITEVITNEQAEYVLAVKGNQKELYEPIIDIFTLSMNPKYSDKMKPSIYEHDVSCEHGKIENRTVKAFPVRNISKQLDLSKWSKIKSIVQIERIDHTNNTRDSRYYISSIAYNEIERLAKSIRDHWQVENNLHWVLDMVFKEDDSRIRDEITVQNMSWIRKMAAFLLKQIPTKMSMKNKMIKNCINPDNMLVCFNPG